MKFVRTYQTQDVVSTSIRRLYDVADVDGLVDDVDDVDGHGWGIIEFVKVILSAKG